MNKEKVRELANYMFFNMPIYTQQHAYNAITEWLEQNQPVPVVVGLSDEQLEQMNDIALTYFDGLLGINVFDVDTGDTTLSIIPDFKAYLETQTFVQPETKEVVVGLSDEQLISLADHISMMECSDHFFSRFQVLKMWMEGQTFAQPETREVPVGLTDEQNYDVVRYVEELEKELEQLKSQPELKEIPVGLSDEQVSSLQKFLAKEGNWCSSIQDWLKTQTFAQPEVVVGLSDEQTKAMCRFLDIEHLEGDVKCWLMGQVFAQPVEFSNVELADSYQSLCEDFDTVSKELEQLKSQQFTPDWGTAPSWANWLAQDSDGKWTWFKNKPFKGNQTLDSIYNKKEWYSRDSEYKFCIDGSNWEETLQERPKPKPQVEVGQVWKHGETGCDYIVKYLTDVKPNDCWIPSVAYQLNDVSGGNIYTRTLSDFLAKFERAQP